MLELADIHVRYGNIRALQGVSLRVDAGQLVALIGSNGAGKSTTLRTISGLLRPTQGTITFEGTDITTAAADRIVAMGISHCPEGRHIFGSLTVAENLRLGAVSRSDAPGSPQIWRWSWTSSRSSRNAPARQAGRCRAGSSRCWPSPAR
jgi:branched-chain amino acid transport system ATP-binding protein